VRATTTIGNTGAGLTGTLRLTWVRDNLAHVIEHADADEPAGTWTGLACPRHGLPVGSDVDISVLRQMCARGEIADLIWEAPEDMAGEHNRRHQAAMQAYQAGDTVLADQEWRKVQDVWSRAWAANCAALELIQAAGISGFSPVKPQRWVTASFEHHCGPYGIQHPHVHNIVIVALTS
jgi:hypothetical protein